jgi:type I restriction enzyme, S subunit
MLKEVSLSECCEIINGSTPSRIVPEYWGGDIHWFTPKDLSGIVGKFVDEAPEKITEAGFKSCSTTMVPPFSLLLTSRAPIGHIAINKREVCTNQGFKSLVPNDDVDVNYLYYVIKKMVPILQDMGNGATFKELSKATLSKVKIPLPPLPVQQKIAAILDASDLHRQKTKTLIEKYDQLTQSIFLEMFGDPVRNEKGWEKVEMNQLCSFTRENITADNIPDDSNYIGLECIEKETGNIIHVFKVKADELKSNKFSFSCDHILYGKLRPYLNKVALPDFDGVCSTDIIPILPRPSLTNRLFISSIMKSKGFVSFATEKSSGANLPRISPREVERHLIINPPLALQNQFAERVKTIKSQKQSTIEALTKSEQLFNTLLQRAFKGELVN